MPEGSIARPGLRLALFFIAVPFSLSIHPFFAEKKPADDFLRQRAFLFLCGSFLPGDDGSIVFQFALHDLAVFLGDGELALADVVGGELHFVDRDTVFRVHFR